MQSVLMRVETPLGPEFVPDMNVVQRAQREDLQRRVDYQVLFIRNARGEVVPDRRYNTGVWGWLVCKGRVCGWIGCGWLVCGGVSMDVPEPG